MTTLNFVDRKVGLMTHKSTVMLLCCWPYELGVMIPIHEDYTLG